jgi:8-oxo-dGTP pyrophosphatase MutT (NUDIX family)
MTTEMPIRDAATVILVRDAATNPAILMGQRGKGAAFMPEKFVFPGGAVDPADATIGLAAPLPEVCSQKLTLETATTTPDALAAAAIRELWEETGLCLGRPQSWADAPQDWAGFAGRGLRPDASSLSFFFRAVTPPGRPRRFDARFFLVAAEAATGDIADMQDAAPELSHLQWVPLPDARKLNLAFITELVLSEVQRHLPRLDAPEAVPFVRNDALDSGVIWL